MLQFGRGERVNIFLFIIVHIFIGLTIIYFYGKLPKALTVFASVFLTMSFLYWGTAFINLLVN
jgi:hypothetical protein